MEEDERPDDELLKKRLLKRIALATVIFACLVAALAIFDRLNTPPPMPEKLTTLLPPAAKSGAVDGRDAAAAPATAPPVVAKVEEAVPERSSAAPALPMEPLPGEKPLTQPATGRLATLHTSGQEALAPYRREVVRDPARAAAAPPAAASIAAVPEPQASARPPVKPGTHPFGLQLGVFSNLDNAQELRARLEKHGIPATIEARVQVGPFATRAEAQAAKIKLQELGIRDSLLIATKKTQVP